MQRKTDGTYEHVKIVSDEISCNSELFADCIFGITYGTLSTRLSVNLITYGIMPRPYGLWVYGDTISSFFDNRLSAYNGSTRLKTAGYTTFATSMEELIGFEESWPYFLMALPHTKTGWDSVPTRDQVLTFLDTQRYSLRYQLATPVYADIETSGLLTTEPSGTVYRQPAVEDSGMYDAGIVVSDSKHPFATLESLAIYDFETGLETDLAVSTAVIASDGLSFTHAGLTDGDIVTYRYLYDDAYPVGESTVTLFDSRYVKIDSVTGKAYKWDLSVASGVASIGLTEVV
jgi:hypothetical protein